MAGKANGISGGKDFFSESEKALKEGMRTLQNMINQSTSAIDETITFTPKVKVDQKDIKLAMKDFNRILANEYNKIQKTDLAVNPRPLSKVDAQNFASAYKGVLKLQQQFGKEFQDEYGNVLKDYEKVFKNLGTYINMGSNAKNLEKEANDFAKTLTEAIGSQYENAANYAIERAEKESIASQKRIAKEEKKIAEKQAIEKLRTSVSSEASRKKEMQKTQKEMGQMQATMTGVEKASTNVQQSIVRDQNIIQKEIDETNASIEKQKQILKDKVGKESPLPQQTTKSYTAKAADQIKDVQQQIEQTKKGIDIVDDKGIFKKFLLGENGDIKSATQLSSEIQSEIDKVTSKFGRDYTDKGIIHTGEEYIKKLEQTFRKVRASYAFGLFDPNTMRDDVKHYYDEWTKNNNRWLQSSNRLSDDAYAHYSILKDLQAQLNAMQQNGGKDYVKYLEEAQEKHNQIYAAQQRNATFKEENFDKLEISQEEADKRAEGLRKEQKALEELTTSTREYIEANKEFDFDGSPLYHDRNAISGLETMAKMLDREASRYENYTRNKRAAESSIFSEATDKMLTEKSGTTKEIEDEWEKLETAILETGMKGSDAIEEFKKKTKELGFEFDETALKWQKVGSLPNEGKAAIRIDEQNFSKQIEWLKELQKITAEYDALNGKASDPDYVMSEKESQRLDEINEKYQKFYETLKQYESIRVHLKNGESYSITEVNNPNEWNTRKSSIQKISFTLKETAVEGNHAEQELHEMGEAAFEAGTQGAEAGEKIIRSQEEIQKEIEDTNRAIQNQLAWLKEYEFIDKDYSTPEGKKKPATEQLRDAVRDLVRYREDPDNFDPISTDRELVKHRVNYRVYKATENAKNREISQRDLSRYDTDIGEYQYNKAKEYVEESRALTLRILEEQRKRLDELNAELAESIANPTIQQTQNKNDYVKKSDYEVYSTAMELAKKKEAVLEDLAYREINLANKVSGESKKIYAEMADATYKLFKDAVPDGNYKIDEKIENTEKLIKDLRVQLDQEKDPEMITSLNKQLDEAKIKLLTLTEVFKESSKVSKFKISDILDEEFGSSSDIVEKYWRTQRKDYQIGKSHYNIGVEDEKYLSNLTQGIKSEEDLTAAIDKRKEHLIDLYEQVDKAEDKEKELKDEYERVAKISSETRNRLRQEPHSEERTRAWREQAENEEKAKKAADEATQASYKLLESYNEVRQELYVLTELQENWGKSANEASKINVEFLDSEWREAEEINSRIDNMVKEAYENKKRLAEQDKKSNELNEFQESTDSTEHQTNALKKEEQQANRTAQAERKLSEERYKSFYTDINTEKDRSEVKRPNVEKQDAASYKEAKKSVEEYYNKVVELQKKLNSFNTDAPEKEIKELEDELYKAQTAFMAAYKIVEDESLGKLGYPSKNGGAKKAITSLYKELYEYEKKSLEGTINPTSFDNFETVHDFEKLLEKVNLTEKSAEELIELIDKLKGVKIFSPQNQDDVNSLHRILDKITGQLRALNYEFDEESETWKKRNNIVVSSEDQTTNALEQEQQSVIKVKEAYKDLEQFHADVWEYRPDSGITHPDYSNFDKAKYNEGKKDLEKYYNKVIELQNKLNSFSTDTPEKEINQLKQELYDAQVAFVAAYDVLNDFSDYRLNRSSKSGGAKQYIKDLYNSFKKQEQTATLSSGTTTLPSQVDEIITEQQRSEEKLLPAVIETNYAYKERMRIIDQAFRATMQQTNEAKINRDIAATLEQRRGDDAIVQYIDELEKLEKQSDETREAIQRAIEQTRDAESAGSSLDLLTTLRDENIIPEDITGNLDKVLEKIRTLGLSADDLKKTIKLLKGDTANFSWINGKGLDQTDKINSLIKLLRAYGLQVKEIENSDAFNTEITTQTKVQTEAAKQTAEATKEAAKGIEKEGDAADKAAKKKGRFSRANREAAASARETAVSAEDASEGINEEGDSAQKATDKIEGYIRNRSGDVASGNYNYTQALNKVLNKSVTHSVDDNGNEIVSERTYIDFDKLSKLIFELDSKILDYQNKINKATAEEASYLRNNQLQLEEERRIYEKILDDAIQDPNEVISESQRKVLNQQRGINEAMVLTNQLYEDAKERRKGQEYLDKQQIKDREALLKREEANNEKLAKERKRNQEYLDKQQIKDREALLKREEKEALEIDRQRVAAYNEEYKIREKLKELETKKNQLREQELQNRINSKYEEQKRIYKDICDLNIKIVELQKDPEGNRNQLDLLKKRKDSLKQQLVSQNTLIKNELIAQGKYVSYQDIMANLSETRFENEQKIQSIMASQFDSSRQKQKTNEVEEQRRLYQKICDLNLEIVKLQKDSGGNKKQIETAIKQRDLLKQQLDYQEAIIENRLRGEGMYVSDDQIGKVLMSNVSDIQTTMEQKMQSVMAAYSDSVDKNKTLENEKNINKLYDEEIKNIKRIRALKTANSKIDDNTKDLVKQEERRQNLEEINKLEQKNLSIEEQRKKLLTQIPEIINNVNRYKAIYSLTDDQVEEITNAQIANYVEKLEKAQELAVEKAYEIRFANNIYDKGQASAAESARRSSVIDAGISNADTAKNYVELNKHLLEYIQLKQKAKDVTEKGGALTKKEQNTLDSLEAEFKDAAQATGRYSINIEDNEKSVKKLIKAQLELKGVLDDLDNGNTNDILNKLSSDTYDNIFTKYKSYINMDPNKFTGRVRNELVELQNILNEIKKEGLNVVDKEDIQDLNRINQLVESIDKDKVLSQYKAVEQSRVKSLQEQIRAFENNNTAMGGEFRRRFNALWKDLELAQTKKEVDQLKGRFADLKGEVEKAGKTGNSVWNSFTKQLKSANGQFLRMYFSWMDWVRYIKTVVSTVRELDTALIDLKKTTSMNSNELEEFYHDSTEIAKATGVTTQEIISQAAAWSRLGYSSKEAAEGMAELSSKFAKISPGTSVDDATDYLVSTMKAFHIDVADVEREIMDVINRVGNKMATTNQEIGEMLKRSSAAMAEANNTLAETIALESAAVQITRNAETTGTAFRTISMRIRGKQSLPPYMVTYMLCA